MRSGSDPSGGRIEGIVQRVLPERGYGFIRVRDGAWAGTDFFFHLSGLTGCKIDDLREGSLVRFEPTQSAKGPRAEDIVRVLLP